MKSLWSQKEAKKLNNDPLKLRVYTSRLLGQNPDLVLHGGGNTSVKIETTDLFGEKKEVLFVKGSGWDLATIEQEGFAPVRMNALLKMAEFESLSDTKMVAMQRAAMIDPYAPNPSVEAILHAIIPFRFVDHTHADAVVALMNTPKGENIIKHVYGKRILIVPYIMPGFLLARKVYEMTRGQNWDDIDAIILMNHGIFTFSDDARESYERMIDFVTKAEDYLKEKKLYSVKRCFYRPTNKEVISDSIQLAQLRKKISDAAQKPMLVQWNKVDKELVGFSSLKNVSLLANRGPLTPDHVIRTKRLPLIFGEDFEQSLLSYTSDYDKYFKTHRTDGLTILDSAPRWGVWKNKGTISIGASMKELNIVSDIVHHTIRTIQWAQGLGGWKALPAKDIFDVEYWELEQAKLKKVPKPSSMTGKIVLVTGAASGIGKACVEKFVNEGAVVAALDINKKGLEAFNSLQTVLPLNVDVTRLSSLEKAITQTVEHFGGIDIVVSNAGIFPDSHFLEDMDQRIWEKSLNVNLTSHQTLYKKIIPYLKYGLDPAIINIASKNVPAPGPGAAAYSVAKAGLTQLARVAALELAEHGIRVQTVHPNQIFDTNVWTKDVLKKRAKSYGISVEAYKRNNLLHTDISSRNVADLVVALAGPAFIKSTGLQVAIDGGNERVI